MKAAAVKSSYLHDSTRDRDGTVNKYTYKYECIRKNMKTYKNTSYNTHGSKSHGNSGAPLFLWSAEKPVTTLRKQYPQHTCIKSLFHSHA